MTATWTTAARRLLVPAIASTVALSLASPASAQEASAEEAGEPAATACAAERCLSVGWSPAVAEALQADRVLSVDELARGLTVDYRGEGPLAVRLVAARYDRGRLVRYGVSERVMLDAPGSGLTIPDADAVLAKAFAPAMNRDVAVEALEHDLLQPQMDLPATSFVGEVPPTYLAGAEDRTLFPMEDVPGEDVHEVFDGSAGVVALLPDDDALRTPEALSSESALVRLRYEPKNRGAATG